MKENNGEEQEKESREEKRERRRQETKTPSLLTRVRENDATRYN